MRHQDLRNRGVFYGTVATTLGLLWSFGPPVALADPADYYVGVGVRAGFNDDTAAVISAKATVADFGDFGLSGRSALLFGNETEFRLALTGEGEIAPNWSPFLGGGVAINTDGSGDVDPLITTGLDFQATEQIVIQVGGNLIFKSNDTDAEAIATVNYAF